MTYKGGETFDISPQENTYSGADDFAITPDTREIEYASPTMESGAEQDKSGRWRLTPLFASFVAVSALALVQAALAVHEAFASTPMLGVVYAAIAVLIVYALLSVTIREFLLLFRLKKNEALRAELAKTVQDGNKAELARICLSLPVNGRKDTVEACQDWLAEADTLGTAKDVLTSYSERVLSKADEEARKIIVRHSLNATALVAISPLALSDMLLIVINSRSMLDKIAGCYCIRLGFVSRIKLYRHIVQNIVIAGVADVLLDSLSAGLTELVARKIGEGLLAGFFSARLGISAAAVCRPLPMQDGDKRLGYADLCGHIRNSFMKRTLGGA